MWIRDILVRIRIRGSVPLTSDPDVAFFRQCLTRCQQQKSFFLAIGLQNVLAWRQVTFFNCRNWALKTKFDGDFEPLTKLR
jgi:hypothetical protein